MRFHVIGDEDMVVGFRFAGVPGTVVETAEEAGEALRASTERRDGVLIVSEGVAESIRKQIDAVRFGQELPLIVEVPGPEGARKESPSLFRLIREAVGIQLED